jgi:flagellar P-ring protein precursor FlgI
MDIRHTSSGRRRAVTFLQLVLTVALAVPAVAAAERIKDIASVAGVRSNPLIGYGLVVGLDGTGDQTSQAPFTVQTLRNMLQQLGVTIPPDVNPQLKNVAAVSVQAELPPFAKPGQAIDVTVSSIGNSTSLRGGALLMTPLRGADGEVYAIAQGNLIVSGLGASGRDGSRIVVNVPSTGRIPSGALVERLVVNAFAQRPTLTLNLNAPDFTSASRMTARINESFGAQLARTVDAVSVEVLAPADTTQRVAFLSSLENLEVAPGEAPARVIVNSRTGTVVIGSHVRVMPAAVTHGSMVVTITEDLLVSQPPPFADGPGAQTVVVPDSSITVEQPESRMFLLGRGVTLNDIVQAVNAVGAAPADLVAILEALKQAGALQAELIVI